MQKNERNVQRQIAAELEAVRRLHPDPITFSLSVGHAYDLLLILQLASDHGYFPDNVRRLAEALSIEILVLLKHEGALIESLKQGEGTK